MVLLLLLTCQKAVHTLGYNTDNACDWPALGCFGLQQRNLGNCHGLRPCVSGHATSSGSFLNVGGPGVPPPPSAIPPAHTSSLPLLLLRNLSQVMPVAVMANAALHRTRELCSLHSVTPLIPKYLPLVLASPPGAYPSFKGHHLGEAYCVCLSINSSKIWEF